MRIEKWIEANEHRVDSHELFKNGSKCIRLTIIGGKNKRLSSFGSWNQSRENIPLLSTLSAALAVFPSFS